MQWGKMSMNKRIKKKQSTIEKYRGVTAKKLRRLLMNRDDIIPYLLYDESNNTQFSKTKIPYWIDKFKKYDIFYTEQAYLPIEIYLDSDSIIDAQISSMYHELNIVNRQYYVIPSCMNPNKCANYANIKRYPSYFWTFTRLKMITIHQGKRQMLIYFGNNNSLPSISIAYHPYNLSYVDNGIPFMIPIDRIKVCDNYSDQMDYMNKYRVV